MHVCVVQLGAYELLKAAKVRCLPVAITSLLICFHIWKVNTLLFKVVHVYDDSKPELL